MTDHWVTNPYPSGIRVRKIGLIDFDELYRFMEMYLENRGLADKKDLEKKYTERIKGDSKIIEAHWRAGKKISEYFSYVIDITFLIIGMTDYEIEENGQKRKTNKGDFEIRISSKVETNDEGWEQFGFLKKIYINLVARKRLGEYKGDLWSKTYSFQGAIKSFLGI